MQEKLYLIEGSNAELNQKEIHKLLQKLGDNIEVINYDLENSTMDDVIDDLDTYDMFLKQKVVICQNPLFLLEKIENFNLNKFEKYLKNPSDNILIIVISKLNNRLKITNLITKYFTKIQVKEITPQEFVKDNLEDFKMDNATITYFLNKVGSNYQTIDMELQKLKSYKASLKVILKEDVDMVTNLNIEASIFDLIDAIIKKDKAKSYELYNHFLSNGTEIFQILVLVSNQIRLIYNVKVLANLKDFEISQILNVKEYPVKLARGKGLNYSKGELLSLLYKLATIDEDIKSGKQLPNISFLTFIMQM